ncbi:MAG: hypothetical protein Q7T82_20330 [Armatimonadota bacterium]|nr:hypothetical protein [Armatimonadota bacterium]
MGRKGSTLAAALALATLIFMIAIACLGRVAASYSQVSMRHGRTNALFLAEAGVQSAGQRLLADTAYAGEKNVSMPTGSFDVSVVRSGAGYSVTSKGRAKSPFKMKPTRTVRAMVTIAGGNRFRVSDWREN